MKTGEWTRVSFFPLLLVESVQHRESGVRSFQAPFSGCSNHELTATEKQEFADQELGITTPSRASTGEEFIVATAEAVGQELVPSGSLCVSGEGGVSSSHRDPQWQGAGPAWGPWPWLLPELAVFHPTLRDFRHLCAHPC